MFLLLPLPASAQSCRDSLKEGLAQFGRYHEGEAHYAEARAAYLKAADDPACAYDAWYQLSDLELCWGTTRKIKKEKSEHFKEGMACAEKAIQANPKGKEGHYQYAVNLGSLVQLEGAMTNLLRVRKIKKSNNQALVIDPKYAPAMVVEANFMSDLPGIFGGSDAEAEKLYRAAVASDSAYETAYVELAEFLCQRKRCAEAKDLLRKVLAPDFPHRLAAPWETIDKPRAVKLAEEVEAASGK